MTALVTAEVFKRYPAGGGELVLALALADQAHDDGTHVVDSVATLAKKTRQSDRTVQRQLRQMVQADWLQFVAPENRARGCPREYRINQKWLSGGLFLTQSKPEPGDIAVSPGYPPPGDILSPLPGDIAVSPKDKIKDKNKARETRARDPGQAENKNPEVAEFAVSVPQDFKPPPWVGDRLRMACVRADWEAHDVAMFVAHHSASGKQRPARAWGNEFVLWMIRERKRFAKPGSGGPEPVRASPAEAAQSAVEMRLADAVSELRTMNRLGLHPRWRDPAAVSALESLGGHAALLQLRARDLGNFIVRFAQAYRGRFSEIPGAAGAAPSPSAAAL